MKNKQTRFSITIQQNHYETLMENLIYQNNERAERIAFLLCGRSYIKADPWDGCAEERLLSKKIVILPENEIVESSKMRITWKTDFFINLLKEVEKENLAIAVVHNHPQGSNNFSFLDDQHEPELFKMIFNRNGGERPHVSLVITPEGHAFGRAWDCHQNYYELNYIRILGDQFKFYYPDKGSKTPIKAFHRQELAFGKALNEVFSSLRIAIIGCGGTGSAATMLLARLGIGKILLIDNDYVDITNLNRLHLSCKEDAKKKKLKVDTISSSIKKIGLGTNIKTIKGWVELENTHNALKSCDIIFGCTDDHSGRSFINRMAYFYLIPVIDMGLIIKVNDSDPPKISVLDGRVTTIFPKNPCLFCRKIIDIRLAYEDSLRHSDPESYKSQKKEAYVVGEGNPSPAVITFTTEVATMAVNEFIQRVQGFRGSDGSAYERRRLFITSEDRKTGSKILDGCSLCESDRYWGRGDMEPFLDRI